MKLESSPFDSRIYGCSIGRLVVEPADTSGDLVAAIAAGRASDFAVLFLRTLSTHPLVPELAQLGYEPVDRLITSTLRSQNSIATLVPGVSIEHHERLVEERDIAALATFTAETMRTSHFHADPRLAAESTRQLFSEWARNDVTHRARRTIVARAEDEVVGYITVLISETTAIIDLVAVSPTWQGRGIGSALVTSFIQWVATTDLEATVGTQATNRALALYARHGFTPTSEHLTYHLWLA